MGKGGDKKTSGSRKKKDLQNTANAIADAGDIGNMDKIRDILFGNQMRDVESQFSKMEVHLSKETADLRSETLKRLDTLEAFIKNELDTLGERLLEEANTRSETDKTLSHEIKDAIASINKKISQVEDLIEKRSKDLRERILDQSKRLSADIQEKYELNSKELANAVEALSDAKVDRSALSELFITLAISLSNETNISDIISPKK